MAGEPVVVEIHSVGDRLEAVRFAECFHDVEEFVFAVEAARRIVARVFGTIEFGRRDDSQRNSLLFSECDRVRQLGTSQAGRIGDYGEHV